MMDYDIFICSHDRHEELKKIFPYWKKILPKNKRLYVLDSTYKKLRNLPSFIEYIHCPDKKALSLKRNHAIKLSRAEIVIFTDDDCIPTKEWINNLTKGFLHENIACVTGRTISIREKRNSAYEKRYSFDKIGKKTKLIKRRIFVNLFRIGHGNNMAFKKEIFKRIGDFDENLGVGSRGLAGEDFEMFYRILKNGYWILYNPRAIIYHDHLIKDSELPKIAYRNGFAIKEVCTKRGDPYLFFIYLAVLLKYLLKFVVFNDEIDKFTLRGLLGKTKKCK